MSQPDVPRVDQRLVQNVLDRLQLLADHDPLYLTDKIVGLVATAGGTQGLQAVNTMEFP